MALGQAIAKVMISIHALREEGDRETYPAGGSAVYISIHALREEGDYESCHL